MGEKTFIILLIFLSMAVPELLTGSTPFWILLNPIKLGVLLVVYGFPALLYREVVVRYGLHSGRLLLLGLVQGLLVEGLAVNTFYTDSVDKLGDFAVYGRFLGVNWPWALYLTMFHSIFSVYTPVMIAESLVPSVRNRPLIKFTRSRISLILACIAVVVALFQLSRDVYHPDPIYQLTALLIMIGLALAIVKTRSMEVKPVLVLPSNRALIILYPIIFITIEFYIMSKVLPPTLHIIIGIITYYSLYSLITRSSRREEYIISTLLVLGLSINGLLAAVFDKQYHIIPPALIFSALTITLYRKLCRGE